MRKILTRILRYDNPHQVFLLPDDLLYRIGDIAKAMVAGHRNSHLAVEGVREVRHFGSAMSRNLKMGTVLGKTKWCPITAVACFFDEGRVPQTATRVEPISEWKTMWRGFNSELSTRTWRVRRNGSLKLDRERMKIRKKDKDAHLPVCAHFCEAHAIKRCVCSKSAKEYRGQRGTERRREKRRRKRKERNIEVMLVFFAGCHWWPRYLLQDPPWLRHLPAELHDNWLAAFSLEAFEPHASLSHQWELSAHLQR